MKRLLASALIATLTTLPAIAQNAGDIAAVNNGAKACVGCNLFQADFAYKEMPGRNFSKSRLAQADLTAGVYDRSKFDSAQMKWINAAAGRFTSASFRNAKMEQGVFIGAYFHDADFMDADITGSMFSGAEMKTARNLTQNQLNTACGDALTRLPSGLTIPQC